MKKKRFLFPVILGILAIASFATSANAVTLIVNPTADTYLRSSENQAYGGAAQILAGSHSTLNGLTNLFRFDLSALPTSGITIDSVTLTLTSNASGSGTAVTLHVFELAAANASWVEGTANGAVVAGDASALYRVNQTTAWAGGATSYARTAGTDYVNTSLASFTGNASTIGTGTLGFTSTGAFSTTVATFAGANLNLWVGTPTLTGANDFFRISSKEASATATSLVINYTAIPEPSTYALLGMGLIGVVLATRHRRRV